MTDASGSRACRAAESDGFVLPVLLLVLIPLLLIASVSISTLTGKLQLTSTALDEERAFQAAEAGIDDAVDRANTATLVLGTPITNDLGRGMAYSITAVDISTDGVDNDLDGSVDEVDEIGYRVTVTGTYRNSRRRIVAYLSPIAELPTLTGALSVQDPASALQVSGSSFAIDGNDINIDGTPGAAAPIHGVTVANPGTTPTLLGSLSSGQAANILGQGGSPSASAVAPMGLPTIASALTRVVHNSVAAGSYSNIPDFGSAAADIWRVSECNGNLSLSGTTAGAGILVVRGNLEVTGNFQFAGLVIVLGNVVLSGGGSSANLRGGLLVGGNSSGGMPVCDINGSIDLAYCSEALEKLRSLLARYAVLAWHETARG